MSKTAPSLENLRLAIHGLASPFWCEGTLVPDKPVTFIFKDRTRFAVTRAKNAWDQQKELKPLLAHCKPAPFGDGKKTRYDRWVRDALQLKAERGGFSVENFDPESAGILEEIRRELVPQVPNPISAELYSVNVYTHGGHFVPHKDTPRGKDMFGTLVVCLPSQFSSGNLVLSHRGVVRKFNWSQAIQAQKEPNRLHWAAFFGDVDHQIERIYSGARVTLAYLLRHGAGGAPPHAAAHEDLAPRVQEAWRALLADAKFLPNGGILGYPCCHLYHQDARFQQKPSAITRQSATKLKGRDHLVAATALQAGLKVTFAPYLFENCADETWQLARFPTRNEKARLGSQMDPTDLEEILPIRANVEESDIDVDWIDPPPSSGETSGQSDNDSELPAAARLHSCEYSATGYFGNEGGYTEFYTYAALHIKVPPFGKKPRVARKPVKRTPAKPERTTRKAKP